MCSHRAAHQHRLRLCPTREAWPDALRRGKPERPCHRHKVRHGQASRVRRRRRPSRTASKCQSQSFMCKTVDGKPLLPTRLEFVRYSRQSAPAQSKQATRSTPYAENQAAFLHEINYFKKLPHQSSAAMAAIDAPPHSKLGINLFVFLPSAHPSLGPQPGTHHHINQQSCIKLQQARHVTAYHNDTQEKRKGNKLKHGSTLCRQTLCSHLAITVIPVWFCFFFQTNPLGLTGAAPRSVYNAAAVSGGPRDLEVGSLQPK